LAELELLLNRLEAEQINSQELQQLRSGDWAAYAMSAHERRFPNLTSYITALSTQFTI
jgi:hypothetical protein